MIHAVIFDLDDTLYDYEKCHKKAMNALSGYCMEHFALTEREFKDRYDRAKEAVKQRLSGTGSSHNRMLYAQTFLEMSGARPAGNALALYDTYWDTMLSEMKLFDYVLPLFGKLSDMGIRIAVLTDLTAHIQHRKLAELGIADYVDVLVTSEEAGCEKPGAAMFELVLKKLGVEPSQAIMIGDSPEKDVKGAGAAGIYGILHRKDNPGETVKLCMEKIRDGKKAK